MAAAIAVAVATAAVLTADDVSLDAAKFCRNTDHLEVGVELGMTAAADAVVMATAPVAAADRPMAMIRCSDPCTNRHLDFLRLACSATWAVAVARADANSAAATNDWRRSAVWERRVAATAAACSASMRSCSSCSASIRSISASSSACRLAAAACSCNSCSFCAAAAAAAAVAAASACCLAVAAAAASARRTRASANSISIRSCSIRSASN